MTQDEIKAEHTRRMDAISLLNAEHEGAVGIQRAHLRRIQLLCSHPDKYETSCMGESGMRCPDCGWSR
jgi:hypothetical protein